MLIKKIALAPALIALSVAGMSLAVVAGPSGGDKNGGHHGGGGGKNGNDGGGHGGHGDGDGKNGDGGGKNGGDSDRGSTTTGSDGDRCDSYRRTFLNRHCRRLKRQYLRARMVPCMQGEAIVYEYGCGRRVVYVPRRARTIYVDAPVTHAQDEDDVVVVRKTHRRLAKRDRLKRKRVVVVDVGGYDDRAYDAGHAGMSRAARMQQERRLRKRMRAQAEYDYGDADDDDGFVQPRTHHRKKKRRHAVSADYGYGYELGSTIHYGPVILKNGAY